jgi:serine phosphatase RsbU (regulator of sigma subunit)
VNERLEILAASEIFKGLSEASLRDVDGQLRPVSYSAGERLFSQGETGDAVYVVQRGTLALDVDGVTLLFREPGECVGEFALIDDGPRSTDAIALTDVHLLRWDRDDFQRKLSEDPGVARGIFRMLTAKLRQDIDSRVRMQLEKERWQQDLARAREIQAGMLPAGGLERAGLAVAGHCRPAAEVGGDFYDYLCLDDDRLGVVIADVTGHGFYSGLFVAMAKSCVHTQVDRSPAPSQIMQALRAVLDLSIRRQLLMTCFYAQLDPRRGCLTYANAGHPYPYLYRASAGALETLEALDPILGALDPASQPVYSERTLEFAPGDVLVLYSDGLTEARDARGQMFDHERLEAAIRGLASGSAAEIRDGILGAVARHGQGVPQSDDLTLVVARAR